MKVKEIYSEDHNDCRAAWGLQINDKTMFSLMDGEPEDNTLARNFNFQIQPIIQKAYDAGKNGEELEYVYEDVEWEDYKL